MSRTIDLSLSVRTRQYLVVGFCLALPTLFVLGLVIDLAAELGVPPVLAMAASVVFWIVLTVLLVRRWGGSGDGSTWNAIPQRQYTGRFAELGGITKKEQEDALGSPDDE